MPPSNGNWAYGDGGVLPGATPGGATGLGGALLGATDKIQGLFSNANAAAAAKANAQARNGLLNNANQANSFGNQTRGQYGTDSATLQQQIAALQAQQSGQNSVSAMQLQQALQQNLGAQQSMAAGASPQNAAMAARTAAIQSGRLGSAAAGQQAIAGLQERNQATQALGQLGLGMRGQDLQGTLGGYGAANQGYGAMVNPTGDQSFLQQNAGAISGLGALIAASDRRLKTDITDGADDAKSLLDGLKAYAYNYKDDKYGKGKQLGVMAQDLEKGGLKQAVINTPSGKMVDGAKLALGLAAVLPGLDKRLSKLETSSEGDED